MNLKENYSKEIKLLDEIYSELVEAIMNKPESSDYETSKIYFEMNTRKHSGNDASSGKKQRPGFR